MSHNTQLKITGMTCGHCVKSVKEALAAVPGVDEVEVELQEGSANISGSANLEALLAAVREEGYTVEANS